MRQEDESEGIEVAWGKSGSGSDSENVHGLSMCANILCQSLAEDQQRISAFSKFNTRLSSIQDELKKVQVSQGVSASSPSAFHET
jgi:hypothetical protein